MTDKLFYQIGLTMINGIGGIHARQLLAAFGDAECIFKEKRQALERVSGIGTLLATEVKRPEVLQRAEKEIAFIEKAHIQPLFIDDENYPARLRECPDAPLLFYYKGAADLNARHTLSIVGTRHATHYGLEAVERLVEGIAQQYPDTLIISGLAYGIDVKAHRSALQQHLPTVGILAHGLDRIYPAAHRKTAISMLENGGLLTDFPSGTEPDRPNFLKRNRIIAGLSEATIVVESAKKGGSLVTAEIAASYNREVYSFPGRYNDIYSAGCNELIRNHKADLITSAEDLIEALQWQSDAAPAPKQAELHFDDSPEIQHVMTLLQENGKLHINQLSKATEMPVQQLSMLLFDLEMNGRITAFPGNMYGIS